MPLGDLVTKLPFQGIHGEKGERGDTGTGGPMVRTSMFHKNKNNHGIC